MIHFEVNTTVKYGITLDSIVFNLNTFGSKTGKLPHTRQWSNNSDSHVSQGHNEVEKLTKVLCMKLNLVINEAGLIEQPSCVRGHIRLYLCHLSSGSPASMLRSGKFQSN